MTRKQALTAAMMLVSDAAVHKKLEEILNEMPFTKWSEATVFDTVDQFVIENGRAPTVREFDKRGMPPHP